MNNTKLREALAGLASEWEKEARSPGDLDSARHTLVACAHALRRALAAPASPEPRECSCVHNHNNWHCTCCSGGNLRGRAS